MQQRKSLPYYDKDATTGLWTLAADQATPTDYSTTGGILTGGTGSANGGGAVYVSENGSFTMINSSIVGNKTTKSGGGVRIYKGKFKMINSSIVGNSADNKFDGGGGVSLNSATDFTMINSKIAGNTATQGNGGGVVCNGSRFTIINSSITGNSAKKSGGGVYYAKGTIGGSSVVSGNTANGKVSNLCLESGYTIAFGTGKEGNGVPVPEAGMSVGVTTQTAPTTAAPVAFSTASDTDYHSYFFADKAMKEDVVYNNTDKKLYLEVPTITVTQTGKDPVVGTAMSADEDFFTVATTGFGDEPTLKLQWQVSDAWSDSAPTGITASLTDKKISIATSNALSAGSYDFRVTNSKDEKIDDDDNPMFVCGSGTLTVGKEAPTITKWPTVTAFPYGKTIEDPSGSYVPIETIGQVPLNDDGVVEGDISGSFAWDPTIAETPATVANSKAYTVIFTPEDSDKYATVSGEVTVTIKPRIVVMHAKDGEEVWVYDGYAHVQSEYYEDDAAEAAASKAKWGTDEVLPDSTGFVGAEGFEADLVMTSDSTITNAGTKPNVIDQAPEKTVLKENTNPDNYIISYLDGTLTVTAKTVAIPTAIPGLVYNKNEQTGVPEADLDDGIEEYTIEDNTATDAGEYTATAKLENETGSNFVWSDGTTTEKKIKWSIAKKPVTVTITPNGGTYGSVTAATASLNDLVSGDSVTPVLTYTGTDYNSPEVPTDAGTYTVTATLPAGASNYELTGTVTAEFTISKANYTDVTTTASGNLKAKANETVDIELPAIPTDASYGTPTVASERSSNVSAAVQNTNKLHLTVTTAIPDNAEAFKVTVPVLPDDNHNGYNIIVTVTPKFHEHGSWSYAASGAVITATCGAEGCDTTPYSETLTISAPAGTPTYDGSTTFPATLICSEGADTLAFKELPTIAYEKKNASGSYETYSGTPKDAGAYKASVTVGEATASVEFTVAKKAPALADLTVTLPNGGSDITYDGQTHPAAAALKTATPQLTGLGTLTIKYQKKLGEGSWDIAVTEAPKNVGVYKVLVSAVEGDNFTATAQDLDTGETITITQREVTLTWQDAGEMDLVYSGSAKTPTVTAGNLVSGDQVEVIASLTGGDDNVNVGRFTFTATGLNNDNYMLPENKNSDIYGITPKAITIKPNDKTATVGDTAPVLGADDYTVTGLVGSDTLTTKPTLAYASTPDMSKTGTVEITAEGATAGSNYTIKYETGTLTVNNRSSSGGGSGSSTPTVTVPVSGDGNSVKAEVSVSGSTATVKDIKDADLAKVVDAEAVEIDLSGLNKNVDTAKIPTTTVEKIGEQTGMSVKLSTATVTFDQTATQEISDQAKGNTVELVVDDVKEVSLNAVQKEALGKLDTAIIIDAHLVSGGTRLCTEGKGGFGGGKATVVLPYELKNGSTPANYSVYYVDDTGKLQKLNAVYDKELAAFVFEIAHFSVYAVAYDENAMSFADVPETAYYYNAVLWAAANGITSGTSATTFSPNAPVTRAQVVTFLWRAAGKPVVNYAMSFVDASGDAYYAEAVRWALAEGITKGVDETHFAPDATCTRAQIVSFLYRYAKAAATEASNPFTDVKAGAYYYDAVLWALANGITGGKTETTFVPKDPCTRAQVVSFLYRWMVK